jgi:hypothetical protein
MDYLYLLRKVSTKPDQAHTQVFNRKVVAAHLKAKPPLSLVFAIPDHPWVDSADGAAVRIAMTVAEAGVLEGRLATVTSEQPDATGDAAEVLVRIQRGSIKADLSIGADVVGAVPLQANTRLSFQGPILVGEGFRLSRDDLLHLGIRPNGLPAVVHPYVIGRDIVQEPEERFVVDFFGLAEQEARESYPKLFQHILDRVKPQRDQVARKNHRENWWIFGEARPGLRRAIAGLSRFIVTVETSKHKPFVFLPANVCPDHKLYVVASSDAFHLGVLSSRPHGTWALAAGGTLEDRPTWTNTTCFLPFPFPDCTEAQKATIRKLGEDLDAHRKRQQAAHPELTITGMYNVLEKLRAGEPLSDKDKNIHEAGLVSVLRQLHGDLDAAVFAAYDWPADLTDAQILDRLVALNRERAEEEAKGTIRWLRPEFQAQGRRGDGEQREMLALPASKAAEEGRLAWPPKLPERIAGVRSVLHASRGQTLAAVAGSFHRAPRKDVEMALEALAALGLAVVYDTSKSGRLWRLTGRRAA